MINESRLININHLRAVLGNLRGLDWMFKPLKLHYQIIWSEHQYQQGLQSRFFFFSQIVGKSGLNYARIGVVWVWN